MDEQELLKEKFKSAVSSTVKAISGNFDLKIQFGGSQSSQENSLSLPEIGYLKKWLLKNNSNASVIGTSASVFISSIFLFLNLFS